MISWWPMSVYPRPLPAVGRVTKTLLLPGTFATGPHAVSGSATAVLNAGPPAAAGVTFAA